MLKMLSSPEIWLEVELVVVKVKLNLYKEKTKNHFASEWDCEVRIQYFVKSLSKTFPSKKRIITESYNICRVTAYIGRGNLSTFTSMTKHDSDPQPGSSII